MDPQTELAYLVYAWNQATAGPAKDIAFNALITWIANNPGLAQNIARAGGGVFASAFRTYLIRAGVVAGIRIAQQYAFEMYLARLAMTFGTAPKIPHPAANGLIFIGAVFLAGCDMKSEGGARDAAKPSYNLYVIKYISTMSQAKMRHPRANIPQPMEFPEWYEKERT